MAESICNKPCIIENQHGFLVVLCTLPQGHESEWCLARQGPHERVTVQWRYGWFKPSMREPDSRKRPCTEPVEVRGYRIGMRDLVPSGSIFVRWRGERDTDETPLFLTCDQEASGEGLSSVHIGHECYGVYVPLGIQWRVRW